MRSMGEAQPLRGPLLITAFESFDGNPVNSSEMVLAEITKSTAVSNDQLVTCVLPVVGVTAVRQLMGILDEAEPSAIVCLGQQTGLSEVSVEKVAINHCAYRIPDNAGFQPVDEPVDRDGPAAYFSTLPVAEIHQNLLKADLAACISYSAGTFVCNYLFYQLMHHLARESRDIPAGFVHLPALPEQVAGSEQPSISLAIQAATIENILKSLLLQNRHKQAVVG